MTYTVAILLPGTTGSTLVAPGQDYDDSNPVWPKQVMTKLEHLDQREALKLLEGTLYAGIPVPSKDADKPAGYDSFAAYFENIGFKYVKARTPQSPPPPKKDPPQNWGLPSSLKQDLLIGFAYDWRLDNATSAGTLQNLLYNIERLYGDACQQIYLIAHSMGGIVSRAYLETGMAKDDHWLKKIKALITLGTPHLGAPLAVDGIIGRLPLDFAILDTLARNFLSVALYSASTYELLPPPQIPFIRVKGRPQFYSIFDPKLPDDVRNFLWKNGVEQDSLTHAKQFFETLNYGSPSSLPPYYCAYGLVTQPATCLGYEYWPDDIVNRWHEISSGDSPWPITGGDEIVPQASARFALRKVNGLYEAKGVNHMKLPGDSNVQQQVAKWMGR